MQSEKEFFRGLLICGLLCTLLLPAGTPVAAQGQYQDPDKSSGQATGATQRYANMPEEAVPFGKFTKPYKEWFLTDDTLAYFGAARDRSIEEMEKFETVNIGFLGPIQNNPESPYGIAMLHGAQLAIEQANARGGYKAPGAAEAKPYALKAHYDSAQWGASSTDAVKMVFNEHVVGVLGSVDGASTHIMLRVALKLEFPIMDTATTDPTVTETRIPWLMHNFPDDRQQGYALAQAVFKERKLKRIGIIRTQARYARIGVEKFFDEAKRIGRVPVLEVKFERGDKDFSSQLRMLQNARVDGVVIWAEAPDAALILKQMRAMEMRQAVFGPSRMCYPQIIELAGPAAEGLITTAAIDPSRSDEKWEQFRREYRARYNEDPDAYAAYGYDGMNILIGAVEKAGLNRGKIMDAFRDYQEHEYEGVAGRAQFDHTLNNIAPLTMARVEDGKFVYMPAKVHSATANKRSGGVQ
jgi:ABC-type branched-subunit amino acid transport system substrate-binding protein